MMSLGWNVLLGELLALEEQLLGAHRIAAATVSGIGHAPRADSQLDARLNELLDCLVATISSLRRHVIAADDSQMGGTVESLGEYVLREKMLVVLAELGQLAEVVRSELGDRGANEACLPALLVSRFRHANEGLRYVPLFIGQVRNGDELLSSVRGKFGRINEKWMPHRPAACSQVVVVEEEVIRYRGAVRDARHAMADLRHEPELAPCSPRRFGVDGLARSSGRLRAGLGSSRCHARGGA
jgi:hypothetical protein